MVSIGVVGGLLSFVPYVGSLTARMFSLSVALFQGWPSLGELFLLALGVVGSGQLLEGNVLSPQLVGEWIGLHPVWLMFALLAFGQLFGFLGLIIAVPTAAAIGVIVRHLIGLYLGVRFTAAGRNRRSHDVSASSADVSLAAFAELRARRFLSAPSNLDALTAIELWPNWAGRMLMLVGRGEQGRVTLQRFGLAAADAIGLVGEALDEQSVGGLRRRRARY